MWEGINRRRFPRANYKCIISIKSKGSMPKLITAHTENLGMGGICVLLGESFNIFSNVELELILDDSSSPIRCGGSIVWVVKKTDPADKNAISYDTGIEFISIKEADRARIGQIVEKILPPS
ncbi:MAG: PilZ domain-containing protein [Candidatus Omnitrophica bacterium]|nr:PilZ domain-containing protein [Candidatus Omnitrophota bacterium]